MTMTDDSPANCTTCGGVCNDKRCTVCKTGYCSKKCQMDDWPAHKKICKDLQLETILARTTDIVQRAFLKFRERTWDPDIINVGLEDGEIVMYDNAASNDQVLFRSFRTTWSLIKASRQVCCVPSPATSLSCICTSSSSSSLKVNRPLVVLYFATLI